LFQIQQELFAPQSTAISTESAVFIDNPMAGNQDCNTVQTVRVTHRARSGGRANPATEFFVRASLAVRDATQFIPDTSLKRNAGVVQRQGELLEHSAEIARQFLL